MRCECCGQESDRLEQIRHWEEHGSFGPPVYAVCPKCAEKEREGFEAASAEWAAYMEPRYTAQPAPIESSRCRRSWRRKSGLHSLPMPDIAQVERIEAEAKRQLEATSESHIYTSGVLQALDIDPDTDGGLSATFREIERRGNLTVDSWAGETRLPEQIGL
jgi:hypothetical protein